MQSAKLNKVTDHHKKAKSKKEQRLDFTPYPFLSIIQTSQAFHICWIIEICIKDTKTVFILGDALEDECKSMTKHFM